MEMMMKVVLAFLVVAAIYCIVVSSLNLSNVVGDSDRAFLSNLKKNLTVGSDGLLHVKGIHTGLGSANRNSKVKIQGDHIDLHSMNRTGDEVNPGAPAGSVQVAAADGKLVSTQLMASHVSDFHAEARNAVHTEKEISNFLVQHVTTPASAPSEHKLSGYKSGKRVELHFPSMTVISNNSTTLTSSPILSNIITDPALFPKQDIHTIASVTNATGHVKVDILKDSKQLRITGSSAATTSFTVHPFVISYQAENDTALSGSWGNAPPSVSIQRVSVGGSASSGVVKAGELAHFEFTFSEEVTDELGNALGDPILVLADKKNGPTVSPSDPKKYAFSIQPSANSTGTATINYIAGKFKGKTSGLVNVQDYKVDFQVDSKSPSSATIVASNTAVTTANPTGTVTLTFLEAVSLKTDKKLTHTGLTFGPFLTTDSKVYTVSYQRNAAAALPINPGVAIQFYGTVEDQNGNSHLYNTLDTAAVTVA